MWLICCDNSIWAKNDFDNFDLHCLLLRFKQGEWVAKQNPASEELVEAGFCFCWPTALVGSCRSMHCFLWPTTLFGSCRAMFCFLWYTTLFGSCKPSFCSFCSRHSMVCESNAYYSNNLCDLLWQNHTFIVVWITLVNQFSFKVFLTTVCFEELSWK